MHDAEVPLLRGEDSVLVAADGHRLGAYRVRPSGPAVAGLVVLQEIFGVNRHIREVCDTYAQSGYEVVAPTLFDRVERGVALGYDAAAVETGRRLRASISWDDTLRDVSAATAVLGDRPIAVLGYCWGGALAFLAATRLTGIACAVSYYGGQTVPFAQERVRVPLLMHFGTRDPRIPADDRETIRRANPAIEMHLFPADHGFNCDHRKEFHAPSAAQALTITQAFLARHLISRRGPSRSVVKTADPRP